MGTRIGYNIIIGFFAIVNAFAMDLSRCLTFVFVLVFLSWHKAAGQLLTPEANPVVEGDDFMGNCTRPTGTSIMFVQVNGEEGRIVLDTSIALTTLTSFTFPNITREDNGSVLTCNVPPIAAIVSSLVLEVLYSPNYTAGLFDEDVLLGMPFSRNLTLDANPAVSNNYTWTRNGISYTAGNVSATSIFIPMTTLDDTGTYTVTAGNTIGSVMVSFDLNVIFPPNYTDVSDQEVNKSDPFSLTFNLDAYPNMGDNFTYSWAKNGVPFSGNSNVVINATSISISSADCSDRGLYNVTATNQLGSDSVSFRLTVLCPPVFQAANNPRMIDVTIGQNFTINCLVTESYPLNPTITLIVLPGNNVMDVTASPSRTVSGLSQAGNYSYVCRADNTRSIVDLTYQVTVTTPTTPTTNPTTSPPIAVPGSTVALIIGIVVGVSVLACVVSILVPVLICCCLGVGVFATIGCLSKKKKFDMAEMK